MNESLQHVRVLELTRSVAGSYAGGLLAMNGATVHKIVALPADASPFTCARKKLHETDELMTILLQPFDVVLMDSATDMHTQQFVKRAQKNALHCFLQIGNALEATEEMLQADHGWASLTGKPDDEALVIGGAPASVVIGAHTAFLIGVALYEEIRTPLTIYSEEILVSALEGAATQYVHKRAERRRNGNRHQGLIPMFITKAQQDFIFIGAPTAEKWALLARWAEIENDAYHTDDGRAKNRQVIEQQLAAWARPQFADELFLVGQAFRLPFAKVQTPEQVRACPQLQERGYFKRRIPWKERVLTVQTSVYKPMCKLRILDLTSMWAGPYCSRLFADLGAEVIKIEAPHRPDGIRKEQGSFAPFFQELNRNKKAITLNLQQQEDKVQFEELVRTADVLIENFSPRVMENFGYTAAALHALNPSLHITSLSAFGQTGDYKDYVGYGPTLEAMGGLASITGYGETPWLPGFSVSDFAAGIFGAVATIFALYSAKTLGTVKRIDVSQYEVAVTMLGNALYERAPKQRSLSASSVKTVCGRLVENRTKRGAFFYECAELPEALHEAPTLGAHNTLYKRGETV